MGISENFSFMNINKEKGINKKLRKSIKEFEQGNIKSDKKEMFFNTKNLSPSPHRRGENLDNKRSKSTRKLFKNEDSFEFL